jgi:myosin-crossreactive antigen
MAATAKAYWTGGGIGSMVAVAFMIRDAGVPGEGLS